jgi:hypothetical protein
MEKPLIQIDEIGTTREMTDEEYSLYLEINSSPISLTSDE